MKLKQELEEIKNKDLSNMTENELKEYKGYLTNYNKNAEKKSKAGIWKKIFNIGGGICSIGAGILMLTGVFSIMRTLSVATMLLNYGIAAGLLVATGIFKRLYKNSSKNAENIKQVCNGKLLEVDRQLSVLEFRKELKAEKEASQSGVEVAKTVEQENLNNTQYTNNVKDQGLDR